MPAMTNLLVKDDAATPIELTLVPITDNPDPVWRANVAGNPVDGNVRVTYTEEKLKNGTYRLSIKTEVPVQETLGTSGTSAGYVAPAKVAYVVPVITTLFAPSRSTIADRANAVKMHVGILQGASASTATGTLNQASVGDAWKNSTAQGPAFLISLIKPN